MIKRKYRLSLNLQQFADDDDMILPDDFQDTPVEDTPQETQDEPFEEEAEDTKPADEPTDIEQPETPLETPKIKVKYNKEERELSVEEAAELAQKGMNYEKAVERAKQEARDAYIAEQGHEWNGKKITTEAEYKQAIMERDLIEKYKDQMLPDEVVQELLESRRDRESRKAAEKEQEEQQRELAAKKQMDDQAAEFLEAFPGVTGKDIKPETWERVNAGIPLKYAYMEQERQELLTKVKVQEQNQQNKAKAPIRGVADHGTGDTSSDPFLEGFDSI